MAKKASYKALSEAQIRKKYRGANMASIVINSNPLTLPSTNVTLNGMIGGGIPYGKILEAYGYESTGKSLLAMSFVPAAQKLGGIVLWGDAENAWSNPWAIANGIDPEKVEIFAESSVEVISDWARDMVYHYRSILTNNQPILLVIDSLAALDIKDNADGSMVDAKAAMGNRAKAINDFWRRRAPLFYKLGVCVI